MLQNNIQFSHKKNGTIKQKFNKFKDWVNQSKFNGIIWFIIIYASYIIIGNGILRVGHFIQYTGTLESEEYRVTGFEHKRTTKSHDDSPGTIYHKYYIEIEYEVGGKTYESDVSVSDLLYDDVVDAMQAINPNDKSEEIIGKLHYKPWNPKKISTYR